MIQNKVVVVDVSFWQDSNYTPEKINFTKMKLAGVDGVIIRAGQHSYIDEDYTINRMLAESDGLPTGAYWYYDSRISPQVQAKKFHDVVGDNFPELGIWADYEENYGGAWSGYLNFKKFIDELKALFGSSRLIGIYTGPYYWIDNVPQSSRDYFKSYPLWIAHYKVSVPLVPSPWTRYTLWQYSSEGDGYSLGAESKEIDMNYFNGTYAEFVDFFDIGVIEPPVGEIMETLYYADLKSGLVSNVRSGIGTENPVVTKLTGPLTVSMVSEKAVEDGYEWYQINSPVEGFIALTGSYTNFRKAEIVTTPTIRYVIEVTSTGGLIINGQPY